MKGKTNKPVEIFTDGSIGYNDGIGGYGLVLLFGSRSKKIRSVSYSKTSVARMEMKAVIRALEVVSPGFDVYLYSDYKIMIDAINRKLSLWVEYGMLSDKANYDLWKRFLALKRRHIEGGSNLQFSWIRSHCGVKYNEVADKLAGEARKKKNPVICKCNN